MKSAKLTATRYSGSTQDRSTEVPVNSMTLKNGRESHAHLRSLQISVIGIFLKNQIPLIMKWYKYISDRVHFSFADTKIK